MRNWLVALLATSLLLLPMTTGAWGQGSGVIEGQVLNATADEMPIGEVPVTLWLIKDQEEEGSLEEITDGEGRFRFQGLDTEGYTYQLEVEFQGVNYGSDIVAFPQGEYLLSMPLTVYESTTSDADLWVERAHLILDFQPGAILVQEVQIFLNGGDKTYVGSMGEDGVTLHFPLPQGASGLQFMEGAMACCVVETEKGIAYNRPILPGSEEFFFTYELRYQSPTYTLSKEIVYPIVSLDVLVADLGVEVVASGLTTQEPLSFEGRRYLHLTGQNLTPADGLTLHLGSLPLEGRPTEPSATTSGVFVRVFIMGLGTLAVLLALGYPFLKRGRGEEG